MNFETMFLSFSFVFWLLCFCGMFRKCDYCGIVQELTACKAPTQCLQLSCAAQGLDIPGGFFFPQPHPKMDDEVAKPLFWGGLPSIFPLIFKETACCQHTHTRALKHTPCQTHTHHNYVSASVFFIEVVDTTRRWHIPYMHLRNCHLIGWPVPRP